MSLPTFLIIGTMKGGTTSLHGYLRQHPEVFMPEQKELNFFVDEYAGPPIDPPEERNWARGIDWYERQFAHSGQERAVGEASPNYSRHPTYPGVAERVAAVLPKARLIYLVRNPIERVFSHYLHDVANGREQLPFHAAIRETERYLAPSRYATQVEEYLRFFSLDEMLVLNTDELQIQRVETVRRALKFIGVDSEIPLRLDFEAHRSGEKLRRPRLFVRARRSRYRRLVPRAIRRRGRQLVARPLNTSKFQMDRATREFLKNEFFPDVRRLSDLTGEDFSQRWGFN